MKSFAVLALLVAAAVAAPAGPGPEAGATIVTNFSDNIGTGDYNANSQTSNGISHSSQGKLVSAGAEQPFLIVQGEYSYPGPDGKLYTIRYTADQNGYNAKGDHLPV